MKRLTLCAAALMVALCFTPARAQLPGFAPPLRQKWAVNFGEPASYPVIADGRVFVTVRKPLSTYGTKLYARDSTLGNAVFDAQTGAQTGTFVSRTIPAFKGTTGFFMNGQQSSGRLPPSSRSSNP